MAGCGDLPRGQKTVEKELVGLLAQLGAGASPLRLGGGEAGVAAEEERALAIAQKPPALAILEMDRALPELSLAEATLVYGGAAEAGYQFRSDEMVEEQLKSEVRAAERRQAMERMGMGQHFGKLSDLFYTEAKRGRETPLSWQDEAEMALDDLETGRMDIDAYTVIEERLLRNCANWVEEHVEYVLGSTALGDNVIRGEDKVRFIGQCSGKTIDFVMIAQMVFNWQADIRVASVIEDDPDAGIGDNYGYKHFVAVVHILRGRWTKGGGTGGKSTHLCVAETARHNLDTNASGGRDGAVFNVVPRSEYKEGTERHGKQLDKCVEYRFNRHKGVPGLVLVPDKPSKGGIDFFALALNLEQIGDPGEQALAYKEYDLPDRPGRLLAIMTFPDSDGEVHFTQAEKRRCAARLFDIWPDVLHRLHDDPVGILCCISQHLLLLTRFEDAKRCLEIARKYPQGYFDGGKIESVEQAIDEKLRFKLPEKRSSGVPSVERDDEPELIRPKVKEVRISLDVRQKAAEQKLMRRMVSLFDGGRVVPAFTSWRLALKQEPDRDVVSHLVTVGVSFFRDRVVAVLSQGREGFFRSREMVFAVCNQINYMGGFIAVLASDTLGSSCLNTFWNSGIRTFIRASMVQGNRVGAELGIGVFMQGRGAGKGGKAEFLSGLGDFAYSQEQEGYALQLWRRAESQQPGEQQISLSASRAGCAIRILALLEPWRIQTDGDDPRKLTERIMAVLRVRLQDLTRSGSERDQEARGRIAAALAQGAIGPGEMERISDDIESWFWEKYDYMREGVLQNSVDRDSGIRRATKRAMEFAPGKEYASSNRSEPAELRKANSTLWHDILIRILEQALTPEDVRDEPRAQVQQRMAEIELMYAESLSGAELYECWARRRTCLQNALDAARVGGNADSCRTIEDALIDAHLELGEISAAVIPAKNILENMGTTPRKRFTICNGLAKKFIGVASSAGGIGGSAEVLGQAASVLAAGTEGIDSSNALDAIVLQALDSARILLDSILSHRLETDELNQEVITAQTLLCLVHDHLAELAIRAGQGDLALAWTDRTLALLPHILRLILETGHWTRRELDRYLSPVLTGRVVDRARSTGTGCHARETLLDLLGTGDSQLQIGQDDEGEAGRSGIASAELAPTGTWAGQITAMAAELGVSAYDLALALRPDMPADRRSECDEVALDTLLNGHGTRVYGQVRDQIRVRAVEWNSSKDEGRRDELLRQIDALQAHRLQLIPKQIDEDRRDDEQLRCRIEYFLAMRDFRSAVDAVINFVRPMEDYEALVDEILQPLLSRYPHTPWVNATEFSSWICGLTDADRDWFSSIGPFGQKVMICISNVIRNPLEAARSMVSIYRGLQDVPEARREELDEQQYVLYLTYASRVPEMAVDLDRLCRRSGSDEALEFLRFHGNNPPLPCDADTAYICLRLGWYETWVGIMGAEFQDEEGVLASFSTPDPAAILDVVVDLDVWTGGAVARALLEQPGIPRWFIEGMGGRHFPGLSGDTSHSTETSEARRIHLDALWQEGGFGDEAVLDELTTALRLAQQWDPDRVAIRVRLAVLESYRGADASRTADELSSIAAQNYISNPLLDAPTVRSALIPWYDLPDEQKDGEVQDYLVFLCRLSEAGCLSVHELRTCIPVTTNRSTTPIADPLWDVLAREAAHEGTPVFALIDEYVRLSRVLLEWNMMNGIPRESFVALRYAYWKAGTDPEALKAYGGMYSQVWERTFTHDQSQLIFRDRLMLWDRYAVSDPSQMEHWNTRDSAQQAFWNIIDRVLEPGYEGDPFAMIEEIWETGDAEIRNWLIFTVRSDLCERLEKASRRNLADRFRHLVLDALILRAGDPGENEDDSFSDICDLCRYFYHRGAEGNAQSAEGAEPDPAYLDLMLYAFRQKVLREHSSGVSLETIESYAMMEPASLMRYLDEPDLIEHVRHQTAPGGSHSGGQDEAAQAHILFSLYHTLAWLDAPQGSSHEKYGQPVSLDSADQMDALAREIMRMNPKDRNAMHLLLYELGLTCNGTRGEASRHEEALGMFEQVVHTYIEHHAGHYDHVAIVELELLFKWTSTIDRPELRNIVHAAVRRALPELSIGAEAIGVQEGLAEEILCFDAYCSQGKYQSAIRLLAHVCRDIEQLRVKAAKGKLDRAGPLLDFEWPHSLGSAYDLVRSLAYWLTVWRGQGGEAEKQRSLTDDPDQSLADAYRICCPDYVKAFYDPYLTRMAVHRSEFSDGLTLGGYLQTLEETESHGILSWYRIWQMDMSRRHEEEPGLIEAMASGDPGSDDQAKLVKFAARLVRDRPDGAGAAGRSILELGDEGLQTMTPSDLAGTFPALDLLCMARHDRDMIDTFRDLPDRLRSGFAAILIHRAVSLYRGGRSRVTVDDHLLFAGAIEGTDQTAVIAELSVAYDTAHEGQNYSGCEAISYAVATMSGLAGPGQDADIWSTHYWLARYAPEHGTDASVGEVYEYGLNTIADSAGQILLGTGEMRGQIYRLAALGGIPSRPLLESEHACQESSRRMALVQVVRLAAYGIDRSDGTMGLPVLSDRDAARDIWPLVWTEPGVRPELVFDLLGAVAEKAGAKAKEGLKLALYFFLSSRSPDFRTEETIEKRAELDRSVLGTMFREVIREYAREFGEEFQFFTNIDLSLADRYEDSAGKLLQEGPKHRPHSGTDWMIRDPVFMALFRQHRALLEDQLEKIEMVSSDAFDLSGSGLDTLVGTLMPPVKGELAYKAADRSKLRAHLVGPVVRASFGAHDLYRAAGLQAGYELPEDPEEDDFLGMWTYVTSLRDLTDEQLAAMGETRSPAALYLDILNRIEQDTADAALQACRLDALFTLAVHYPESGFTVSQAMADLTGFLEEDLHPLQFYGQKVSVYDEEVIALMFKWSSVIDWHRLGSRVRERMATQMSGWAEQRQDDFSPDYQDFAKRIRSNFLGQLHGTYQYPGLAILESLPCEEHLYSGHGENYRDQLSYLGIFRHFWDECSITRFQWLWQEYRKPSYDEGIIHEISERMCGTEWRTLDELRAQLAAKILILGETLRASRNGSEALPEAGDRLYEVGYRYFHGADLGMGSGGHERLADKISLNISYDMVEHISELLPILGELSQADYQHLMERWLDQALGQWRSSAEDTDIDRVFGLITILDERPGSKFDTGVMDQKYQSAIDSGDRAAQSFWLWGLYLLGGSVGDGFIIESDHPELLNRPIPAALQGRRSPLTAGSAFAVADLAFAAD